MSYVIAWQGTLGENDPADQPYTGEVRAFPWGTTPQGWLPCDGRSLSIPTYPALYTLIGVTFGGDGYSSFNLPDLRGRVPIGFGQGANLLLHPDAAPSPFFSLVPQGAATYLLVALATAATDNGWVLEGSLDIRFEVDASRRAGVPNALAVDPEGPKRAEPTAPPTAPGRARPTGLAVVRTDTGARTPLGRDAVTIGRSSDSTITIDDTRVSRAHATIERGRSGWTVTDNGSSNGTAVNGKALPARTPKQVSAGDRIGIGPVELRIEADGGQPPGGRALDDSDRTRISGEVLPPPRKSKP